MPKFVPLDENDEMTDEERAFVKKCGATGVFFDSKNNELVVKVPKRGGGHKIFRGRGTDSSDWRLS